MTPRLPYHEAHAAAASPRLGPATPRPVPSALPARRGASPRRRLSVLRRLPADRGAAQGGACSIGSRGESAEGAFTRIAERRSGSRAAREAGLQLQ